MTIVVAEEEDAATAAAAGGSHDQLLEEGKKERKTSEAEYYLYDLEQIPQKTWTVFSSLEQWLAAYSDRAGREGFKSHQLSTQTSCPWWVQVERGLFYPLYFLSANVLPFSFPLMGLMRLLGFKRPSLKQFIGLVCLQVVLMRLQFTYWSRFLRRIMGHTPCLDGKGLSGSKKCMHFALDQLFELERLNHKYFNSRWVLPRSLVEQEDKLPPSIICLAPHGLLPLGISASLHRFFGGRMTRFGFAPILHKVWGMQALLEKFGTYPACKKGLLDCLEGGDNAGLILDGIPGMFHNTSSNGDEELYMMRRKAICKIALQAGSPIIPCYCFGTNELWRIVDPCFGLLRKLSSHLDVALTPFFGRFWLPFGPPARRPLTMCVGDPIPGSRLPENATPAEVSAAVHEKHRQLLQAYKKIFDTHKAA
eukprot:CAMPEP_0206517884 /NCGR_PEP_ID=MMETSP0324_2-20121206/64252_1 /ASSEMBLY_ACC=CAM_ASM_000836 /TAXON_ID=2866 /ORGANISM="Crypthecodinium cohnii, Strain Seligo" /LENGTH=420 /DNA_ID=CAMNT_0054011141 /DNA_START=134 /DNA_END=1392 /DNA_ORIENTATION=-